MSQTIDDQRAALRQHLADLTTEAEKIMNGLFDRDSLRWSLELLEEIEFEMRDLYSVRRAENAG